MTAALRLFDDSEKRRRENWLAEFGTAWMQAYGGLMNFGIAARYLRPLVELHGHAKVLAHFRYYLTQTDARFVSVARFAETFGAWSPSESRRKPGSATDDQIASKLRSMPAPLNWGPYQLQQRFASVGFDGLTEREQADLIAAYRKDR